MHVPSKVPKCSPIRSCRFGRSNVPTLKTTLKNAPDVLAQNFLEITDLTATGEVSARPSQKTFEIFWRFERAGERTGYSGPLY